MPLLCEPNDGEPVREDLLKVPVICILLKIPSTWIRPVISRRALAISPFAAGAEVAANIKTWCNCIWIEEMTAGSSLSSEATLASKVAPTDSTASCSWLWKCKRGVITFLVGRVSSLPSSSLFLISRQTMSSQAYELSFFQHNKSWPKVLRPSLTPNHTLNLWCRN